MTDDELREMVAQSVASAVRVEAAAASIAESAHLLMDLINRTQADAAKMIAGQLKRTEFIAKKLDAMREAGGPTTVGSKIRTSDGRLIEVPTGRPDAQDPPP